MPKVDVEVLEQIRERFKEYEREMRASNYSKTSKGQMINHADRFLRWLADQYSPLDYDGSLTP